MRKRLCSLFSGLIDRAGLGGHLDSNESIYLRSGKYILFVIEIALDLDEFASHWAAHVKPKRLIASSEHTINLEWGTIKI